MRSCWLIVGVAACYSPTAPAGAPCTPAENNCPAPQSCVDNGGSFICSYGPGSPEADALVFGDAAPSDTLPVPADVAHDAVMPDGAMPTPIVFVQAANDKPVDATTALVLPMPVAEHDTLIVCLNIPTGGATFVSATDSLGNHYDTVFGPFTGSNSDHYIFVARNAAAGADTFTLTLSAATGGGSDMFMLEYAGLIGFTDPYDVSSAMSGTGTGMDSGSATTTAAHELLLGYAEAANATPIGGFTQRATQSGNLIEDHIVNATGTYSAKATTTGGAWTMTMATFRGH